VGGVIGGWDGVRGMLEGRDGVCGMMLGRWDGMSGAL